MELIEAVQKQLVPTLLGNRKICALVGLDAADAFMSSNPPRPSELKNKRVFDYKKIPGKQEQKTSYITCDYIVEHDNPNIYLTVAIYVFVHEDLVRLVDDRNRIFALSTEITKTLKQTVQEGTLPGIGRWNFSGLSSVQLSDTHPGVCLLYSVVSSSALEKQA